MKGNTPAPGELAVTVETSVVSSSRVTGGQVPGSIQGLGLGGITRSIIWSQRSKIHQEDLGTGKEEVLNSDLDQPGTGTRSRSSLGPSRGPVRGPSASGKALWLHINHIWTSMTSLIKGLIDHSQISCCARFGWWIQRFGMRI